MNASSTSVRTTVLASAAVLTAMVVAAALLLGGRGPADAPVTSTVETTASEVPPEVEPDPPAPVQGDVVEVSLRDLSVTGSGLRTAGSGPDQAVAVEQEAVDAAVEEAVAFVDAHLTSAHDGDGGQLPEGLDGPRDAVTTGLASADLPAVRVSHNVAVGVLGTPEWVSVGSVVERVDGSTAAATFVFTVTDGHLELIAVQAGAGAEVPPTDDEPEHREDGDDGDPEPGDEPDDADETATGVPA